MKVAEIKELSVSEIYEKIQVEREQLTRLRMNHAVSPLENPMQIRETRRNIARLKTALQKRQVEEKK